MSEDLVIPNFTQSITMLNTWGSRLTTVGWILGSTSAIFIKPVFFYLQFSKKKVERLRQGKKNDVNFSPFKIAFLSFFEGLNRAFVKLAYLQCF